MIGSLSARHAVLEPEPHDAQHLRDGGQPFFVERAADPVLERREDLVLGGAAHGEDEGDVEARAVGVVQRGEACELLRGQLSEPGSGLLARASRP